MSDELEALRAHYRIEKHGDKRHLYCNVCGRGWSLPTGPVQPGNILKLLNHAYSHKQRTTNEHSHG